MKRNLLLLLIITAITAFSFTGCELAYSNKTAEDINNQRELSDTLVSSQSTPTDLDYSLERYNLIKRAYWVNGQREKANTLPCEIERPLGYIVLFTESSSVIGKFTVDGKVTSLNSYLTPDTTKPSGTIM